MSSKPRELPSAARSLALSMRLGYHAEPMLLVVSFVTTLLAAAPDTLFALGLAGLANAVASGDDGRILAVAIMLAALATASWILGVVSDRVNNKMADRASVYIESHVMGLQSQITTIEHHERVDYLDRLTLLRDHAAALSQLYQMLFSAIGAILRLVIAVVLVMSVNPLLGLLGLFAVPTVLVSNWRAGKETLAREAGAQYERRARNLFLLGTTAGPGKEVRVSRVQDRLAADNDRAWEQRLRPLIWTRWVAAAWQAAAYAVFGCAFVGGVVFVARQPGSTAGDALLVVTAGMRLSQYVGQTVRETHLFRTIWLDGARRLTWLEDYARSDLNRAEQPVPDRLQDGITFTRVSFRYPGTDRDVLTDVDLTLAAGTVVAIVGENGAGKSTLVKLISRFYEPTSGVITVDGADLSLMSAAEWRTRLAGAFQDFVKFELPVQQAVGVGDLPRIEDTAAIGVAIDRAGAKDAVEGLSAGLTTQLGVTWDGGVDLSHGQWQKVALARGFMRTDPLVLMLDEPTSALDAETEHALFERYAAATREADPKRTGRIVVLVSHRFSTVRMADTIIVVDRGRIVEHGSHDELMARGGTYADLYGIQAASYR